MILRGIDVTSFRSVRGSAKLHVDQFVTVLIGANDHGKSNLLAAIHALNDDTKFTEEDRNWDAAEDDPRLPSISWTFDLTEAEQNEINMLGFDAATSELHLGAADNEGETEEQEEVRVEDLAPVAAEPKMPLSQIVFRRAGPDSKVEVELPDQWQIPTVRAFLLRERPRIELFNEAVKIVDSITETALFAQENAFMQGMFRKAGLWDHAKGLFTQNSRTGKMLANASVTLTDQIRADWRQGKDLEFLLQHAGTEGNRIEVHIKDPAVERQWVRPSQRSAGFSAFFGISMALFARKEASEANNFIFVFDEPAPALHPNGQVNLQRVFEALAQKHQFIYTTHSIFMISKNFPARNRTVTKTAEGTRVDHKPFAKNWSSVRSNLGLDFSNNFYVADTTLLVEGPSDPIYIASMLRTLGKFKKIDVDLNLFSVVDAGDSRNMVAMARLALDEGRKVVALVDGDKQGNAVKSRLERLNGSLRQGVERVVIHQLGTGLSIENYALFPDALNRAVCDAATELARDGFRVLRVEYTEPDLLSKLESQIALHAEVTLGKAIEKVTRDWFTGTEKEGVSKLQIARNYDEIVEREEAMLSPQIEDRSLSFAKALIDELGLPKKMAEQAVTASE